MKTSTQLSRIAFAAIAAAFAGLAGAAQLSFMRVDGISGESKVKGHENEIEITSYSQSISQRSCGRAAVAKHIDLASPGLAARAASGSHIRRVTITTEKSGEQPFEFFVATMEDVVIESISIGDGDTTISEQVTLNPRTLQIDYHRQNADGTAAAPVSTRIHCF